MGGSDKANIHISRCARNGVPTLEEDVTKTKKRC